MLKKYLFFILLPLSMTSFGQSLSLHAEQDASENSQQALTKETVTKNLDLEKASLSRRIFSGTLTLLLEGGLLLVATILFIHAILGKNVKLFGFEILKEGVGEQLKVTFNMNCSRILTSLLFSLFAGCMSFNAAFKLKIVDKNGEDTTFKQRFWYAFSFWLFPFVCSIVENIILIFIKLSVSPGVAFFIGWTPFLLTLIAQLVLLIAKKKTLSEYVTGMQVVKKPSAPVAK